MSETEEEERFLRLTQKDYAVICHCMMLAYTLAPRVFGDEYRDYLPNHWSENLEAVGPNHTSGCEIYFRSNLEIGRKRKIYARRNHKQRL